MESNEPSPSTPMLRGDGATAANRRHVRIATPLGDMLITASDVGLIGAHFDGQAHQPDAAWFGIEVPSGEDAVLETAAEQLAAWFDGRRDGFDLPLAPLGTPFQRSVWELLLRIPRGETTTYGALSAALAPGGVATPGKEQGVGQAVGHNPISIIVPCHRVVGSDGSLVGFAGGLDRKRWLLAHEETETTRESRLF